MSICPHCGQDMPERAPVSDATLLAALKHPGPFRAKDGRVIAPWLYAAADPMNTRVADLKRWYVTGPIDRRGYVRGPFPLAQVERLAASGKIKPVEIGGQKRPEVYELAR